MEDLVECLTDHQYAGAIGKSGDEKISSAIMDHIVDPPDEVKETVDKISTDYDSLKSSPWGRFMICEAHCRDCDGSESSDKKASREYWKLRLDYLDDVQNYELIRFPLFRDVQNVVDRASALADDYDDELNSIIKDATAHDKDVRSNLMERVEKSRVGSAKTETDTKFRPKAASVLEPISKDSSPDVGANTDIPVDELPSLIALRSIFKALSTKINDEIKGTCYPKFEKSAESKQLYKNRMWFLNRETVADDFVVFRDLGKGAFGVVSGAKNRFTGHMTALKTMQRKLVIGKKAHKVVRDERAILVRLGERPNPFVVHAKHCFYDSKNFYFALPLMTGGDLSFHLRTYSSFDDERTRFWCAQILLGLEHMHSLGVIYRDLKPENVLLGEDGNLRISDLGLAYLTKYTPMTIGNKGYKGRAGTPGYWCPEMVQKKPWAFEADWWSFGCCLYELLVGKNPFSPSITKLKDRNEGTLNWEIKFPEQVKYRVKAEDGDGYIKKKRAVSEDAQSICQQILLKRRSRRLGTGATGAADIKEHVFFASCNWAKLAGREVMPPWKPPADQINALSQSDLEQLGNHSFHKIKLTGEDVPEKFNHTSRMEYEREVVLVERLKQKGMLSHVEEKKDKSSACIIL